MGWGAFWWVDLSSTPFALGITVPTNFAISTCPKFNISPTAYIKGAVEVLRAKGESQKDGSDG